ncbi:BZ3500_MvSof-1268-A1-R1_Chr4-2g06923 [Microbotryum saponariae]|uniref:BZ3500_MvSof-1268-A1-R1_Chr4-2g06923 protein n=1 Tax=Microbotryum saponariae TaxID=289078 RepID=A0A2X0LDN1_9BASI|nr:BZ3500_MvSof-1268-A1-R1_Chr4-2g06923 [Microbotryum saponariae]SDA06588.1 BZ3501_MvSof-1269-A2-R1_Chr4-2g06634 [Microbotryum saponariae]
MSPPKRSDQHADEDLSSVTPSSKRLRLKRTHASTWCEQFQLGPQQQQQQQQQDPARQSALRTVALLHSMTHETRCSPAWSCTNLLAVPLPPNFTGRSSSSSSPSSTSNRLAVHLTHLAVSASAPRPRLDLSLYLPPSSTPSHITHLSFSPCGAYLLVSSTSHTGDKADRLTVFEQLEGCIDEWAILWHESLDRFGANSSDPNTAKTLVNTRWIGEPKQWWPTSPEQSTSSKPFFSTPPRSAPIPGCAFVAVLSSSEALFVHLPRMTPMIPLTALLPLRPSPPLTHLSLTALPTAPSYIPGVPGASPSTNAVDSIVANLVDATSNLTVPNPTLTSGPQALKQELEAAQAGAASKTAMRQRRVVKAALGTVGGPSISDKTAIELGETTFLIATSCKAIQGKSGRVRKPKNEKSGEQAATTATTATVVPPTVAARDSPDPDDDEFGLTDFNALDEAFGNGSPNKVGAGTTNEEDEQGLKGVEEGDEVWDEGEDAQGTIEMSELRIEMGIAAEGPQVTLRPLASVFVNEPHSGEQDDGGTLQGELVQLDWIEQVAGVVNGLHLLAVTTTVSSSDELNGMSDHDANLVPTPTSTLTTWSFSEETYVLAEAFASLEHKKGEATTGQKEWNSRRMQSVTREGVVSCLDARHAKLRFGSVMIGVQGGADELGTQLIVLDSETLQEVSGMVPTVLQRNDLYSELALSTLSALVCSLPVGSARFFRPTICALNLGAVAQDTSTLSTRLALSFVQRSDNSDIIGRIIGAKDDVQTLTMIVETRNKLQRMLPGSTVFENTPLMFELMGAISTIYNSSLGLALRGSIATDLLRLGVCLRAYRQCERRDRNQPIPAPSDPSIPPYRCESDAVWHLISHATWFCDFSRHLAQTCSSLPDDLSKPLGPHWVLLLHPFPRGLIKSIVEAILGLQAFLRGFPIHQNFTVDMAKMVLDDAVEYNGLILTEWRKVLDGFEGAVKVEPGTIKDALVEFSLPPGSVDSSVLSTITTALSNTSLFLPRGLPTPSSSADPTSPSTTYDIVRRCKLDRVGSFKVCTRCGEKAERKVGNETGKWAAYELGWETRCMCGGAWRAEKVVV